MFDPTLEHVEERAIGEPMPEPLPEEIATAGTVSPQILLADVSPSMIPYLSELTEYTRHLVEEIRGEPDAARIAHLALATFDSQARVVLPFTQIKDESLIIDTLTCQGSSTNYGAGFDLIHTMLDQARDLAHGPNGTKLAIYRPTLYMLSDGAPNPGWESSLARLNQHKARPNILCFGFGQADIDLLKTISPNHTYQAQPGQSMKAILEAIMEIILRSVIAASAENPHGYAAATNSSNGALIKTDIIH